MTNRKATNIANNAQDATARELSKALEVLGDSLDALKIIDEQAERHRTLERERFLFEVFAK